jgi:hypothetical protein
MPYQHIEEILSRKGEKIAMFLTIENSVGLILAAFPFYLLSAAMPLLLRVAIVVAAGACGVIATLDVGGMALYERLLWRARGELRRRINRTVITPEHLVGQPTSLRRERPLAVGGPVQLRPTASARLVHQRVQRMPVASATTVMADEAVSAVDDVEAQVDVSV